MYQLPSLLTTQGLGLTKKGSVVRPGQGGDKPHSWRKPHETDCPQHPHGILCSHRTGPQWFNLMHKDVAHTVLNIPATGTQMAPAFYFKIEIIDSKKVHTAHGSTQTYLLIPKKVRPSWDTNSDLSHLCGAELDQETWMFPWKYQIPTFSSFWAHFSRKIGLVDLC